MSIIVVFQKNELDYEQKGDSKKLSARFSDTIGEDLVQSLAHLLGGQRLTVGSNPFFKSSGTQVAKGSMSLKDIQEAAIISEVDPNSDCSFYNKFGY